MQKKRSIGRKIAKLALIVLSPVLLGASGWMAWQWRHTLAVERVEVIGERHAEEQDVAKLARVDTGVVLFDLQPEVIADRVQRHPWVRDADVSRIPTGTLRIDVVEREPILLVLGQEGTPEYYLDENGFAMPLVDGAAFDVPVLTGLREPNRPSQPTPNASVRELAQALAAAPTSVRTLVSEVDVQRNGELWVYTMPSGTHGSMPVRLGRSGYDEKLRRLDAFWRQAVLPQTEKTFAWIDLRFNSQIITEEAISDQPSAGRRPSTARSN